MTDYNNEQISALVDNESDDNDDIVGSLIKDKQLQDTWSRYHLIGDCLRGNLPDTISRQVHSRVNESLQSEATILAPQKTTRLNIKPVAGFALAASVAMVAVFSVQKLNEVNNAEPDFSVAANNVNTNTVVAPASTFEFRDTQVLPAAVTQSQSDAPDALARQRLNNYLMNHNEYRSNGNINGILPYVRIVTIESQE